LRTSVMLNNYIVIVSELGKITLLL
jgi:hypothetical protein